MIAGLVSVLTSPALGNAGTGDLRYATYLGGYQADAIHDVDVGPDGTVYVVGEAQLGFPELIPPFGSSGPGLVAGLDPSASGVDQLVYSARVGGEGVATAIEVDPSGIVHVAGYSGGSMTTTSGAADTEIAPGGGTGSSSTEAQVDGFYLQLDLDAAPESQLRYATYWGGRYRDQVTDLAVGVDGRIYLTGWTWADDFPTTLGAYDRTANGNSDGFLTVLDPAGNGSQDVLYSTLFGGLGVDESNGVALGDEGSVYLSGRTRSLTFPSTAGAFDTSFDGGDAFLVSMTPGGAGTADLLYGTALGGMASEWSTDLAIDDSTGDPVLTGATLSPDFPTTPDSFDPTYNSVFEPGVATGDAFVTRISPDGMGSADLTYSTYLGGGAGDNLGSAIASDGSGNVVVTGIGWGPDFPATPGALSPSFPEGAYPFLAMLQLSGLGREDLLYSTRLGPGGYGNGIAVTGPHAAVAVGQLSGPGLSTTVGAYDDSHNGDWDGFVSSVVVPVPVSGESASAAESDGSMDFVVRLSQAWSRTVTVDYRTSPGTAEDGTDFVGVSGTLEFPPGATERLVSVPLLSDGVDEENESLLLRLEDRDGAAVWTESVQGTIEDVDPERSVEISDRRAREGTGGATRFSFRIGLSGESVQEGSVTVSTTDGTATSGSDYVHRSPARIVIPPERTSVRVVVRVRGDRRWERTERFRVVLSDPVNLTIGDRTGRAEIVNDDRRRRR